MNRSKFFFCALGAIASGALVQSSALTTSATASTWSQQQGQSGEKGQKPGSTGQPGAKPATGTPQAEKPTGAPRADGRTAQQPSRLHLQPGEDLMGRQIEYRGGGQLGRVNDIVIRPDGSIGYVVLDAPRADQGSAHYPIPWSQLQFDTLDPSGGAAPTPASGEKRAVDSKGRLVARFENDRFKDAPSFDSTRWPKDTTSFDEADRYYGAGAAADGRPRPATGDPADRGTTPASAPNEMRFRGSQIKDQVVVDSTGAPIGKIGRMVLDPAQGRVNYVAITLSNVAGGSGRTIAVPWSALQPTRAGEVQQLKLNLPADKLQNAPQFKAGTSDWNEMSDPNWVRSVYGYYGVEPYWSSMPGNATDPNARPGDTRTPPATPEKEPR